MAKGHLHFNHHFGVCHHVHMINCKSFTIIAIYICLTIIRKCVVQLWLRLPALKRGDLGILDENIWNRISGDLNLIL